MPLARVSVASEDSTLIEHVVDVRRVPRLWRVGLGLGETRTRLETSALPRTFHNRKHDVPEPEEGEALNTKTSVEGHNLGFRARVRDARLFLRHRIDWEERARAHKGHEGSRGRLGGLNAVRKGRVRVAKDREVLTPLQSSPTKPSSEYSLVVWRYDISL